MRFIKQSPLNVYGLTQANENPPTIQAESTSRWSSFGYKTEVLQRLCRQQCQLCCYSEVRADKLGLEYHIEHIENKSQNPTRTFDESNLAASIFSSDCLKKLQKEDIFGGHTLAKQTSVDITRFVSCYQNDCEHYFAFLSDGRIVPKKNLDPNKKDKAEYTINLLNLNCHFLINLRKQHWDDLDELYEEHLEKNWDLEQLCYLELVSCDNQNGLSPFYSLTKQFFGKVADKVIQQQIN